jgi:hypothetical protein
MPLNQFRSAVFATFSLLFFLTFSPFALSESVADRMSTTPAASQCFETTTRWLAPRTRIVVDPIWKVIDAGAYNRAWDRLITEAKLYGFVGFDMEWTTKVAIQETEDSEEEVLSASTARRKPQRWTGPVATIQLSTFSCSVVVRWSHLHALVSGNENDVLRDPYASISTMWPSYRTGQKANPKSVLRKIYADVKALIADPTIFLVGVGIHGDEVKLHREYPKITAQSSVELTALAEACLPDVVVDNSSLLPGGEAQKVRTNSLQSLKKLCSALTGKELGKDTLVVMSDWGGCHGALTRLQIEYSAADAEASYDVCVEILKGGGFLHDRVFTGGTEDDHGCRVPWSVAKGLDCREVLACCSTANGKRAAKSSLPVKSAAAAEQCLEAPVQPSTVVGGCEMGKTEVSWCKGRSRPYYDNINVYSPDMQLVFTVDKAKADWYVNKKGLATVVEWRTPSGPSSLSENSPPGTGVAGEREMAAIQLKFAPDFARYNDAHIRRNLDYFKQPKQNICVVCGEGGSLVRFAVVPFMYRRFFPSVYMSHNSYDLLLLCPRCFAKSRQLYDQLRLNVAADFDIPLVHLRGDRRDAYAARVRRMEDNIEALSRAFEERDNGESAESEDTPGKDCDLHPRLRLQGMLDYLALVRHREVLDKVFSYAKALHSHYQSLTQHSEVTNVAPSDRNTGDAVVPSPPSPPPPRGKRKTKRHGHHAAGPSARKITAIPEERRQMMVRFLCAKAPLYPFYAESGADESAAGQGPTDAALNNRFGNADGEALQKEVFCDTCGGGPASSDGVLFILTGSVEPTPGLRDADADAENKRRNSDCCVSSDPSPRSNSSRGVLTRYWAKMHPELVAMLPTVTRAEERQRGQWVGDETEDSGSPSAGSPMDNETTEVPYVDSHAFLVLQLLLKKYEGRGPSAKTAENAVGQFIFRWRSSFVEGMKPQHLPRGWTPEDGILR